VCGNGVPESGEECDDGDSRDDNRCSNQCRAHDTLDGDLEWTILGKESASFSGDTCGQVDADWVKLDLTGPMDATAEVDCAYYKNSFVALVAGNFTVTATLLDEKKEALTRPVVTSFTIVDKKVPVPLDFPLTSFLRQYTGNYYYRIKWGGADTCSGAVPAVAKTRVQVLRDGKPLSTDDGRVLDGMTATDCQPYTAQAAEVLSGVPWGPAQISIAGLDQTSARKFEGNYDTFIGAGVANPEMHFDVPAPSVPDAGL
jgi:hypothetical protein